MASTTVSTTAAEVLPRNRYRRSWIVQNEDAVIDVFIKRETIGGTTVSTTDHDHRLAAGGNVAINDLTDGREAVQDRWTVVSASGTPRISFFETEDVRR